MELNELYNYSSIIINKLMNEIVIYSQIYNYKRWMQRNKLY